MTIGIGILGLAHGHIATYCRRWAAMTSDAPSLATVWDHDRTRADEAHDTWGMAACESAEALCRRDNIQGVIIGAETSLHAELVEIAAAAGKTIVLQKPIALTLEQADRIVAAVDRHQVPFTLAWQMRIDPQNLRIKQLLADGGFGRVFMVRRRHGLPTHQWKDFDKSWHVRPELNRGMWADDAAHAIDFMLWLLGKPRSVMAEIDTLHNPSVPDDHGVAIFRYPDGAFAEVACSFVCSAGENTTEVVCERGTIIQNFGDVPSANIPRPPGGIGLKWFKTGDAGWTIEDIASPSNHGQRIAALAPAILEFFQGRRPAIATAEEGRTALEMTLACHRSSELGRRVEIA